MATLSSYINKYNLDELDADFWYWYQEQLDFSDEFRPMWNTTDVSHVNTIAFGTTFPVRFTINDEIIANYSVEQGANFLINNYIGNYENITYWRDSNKIIYYDVDTWCASRLQFNNIKIDPRLGALRILLCL
ncbi:MAG: hypothetical protein ACTSUN_11700 [Promethearchaeota archaeon]